MNPEKNTFRAAQRAACDFLLVFTGPALLAQFFLPAGVYSLALALLRLNDRARRSVLMFPFYWLPILLTLDHAMTISSMAVFSRGLLYIALPVAAYAAALALRAKTGFLSHLTATHLLIVPLAALGVLTMRPQNFMAASCDRLEREPAARLIAGNTTDNIPRFVFDRPDRGDILISYKIDPPDLFKKLPDRDVSIRVINRQTGGHRDWLRRGNVLGMDVDPATGDVFAVLAKSAYDTPEKNPFPMSFIRFSPDGEVKAELELPLPRSSYYVASVHVTGYGVLAIVEDRWFLLHPADNRLEVLDAKKATRGSPIYFSDVHGRDLVGVFSPSFFLLSVVTGRRNIIKVDLEKMAFEKSVTASPFGYYDVKHIPGTDNFAGSRTWMEGGLLVNSALDIVRELPIPQGTRNIEVSSDGSLLFTGGYYNGMVGVLDMEKNSVVAGAFAGKAIRGMDYTRDGKLLVGCKCGLVELDVEKIMKGAE